MSDPSFDDGNSPAKGRRLRFFDDIYRPEAKILRFLSVLFFFGVSYGLYLGIRTNYLVEIVGISQGFEWGLVEVFRELPGLFLVLILALMYKFTDSRLFKIGVALSAGGIVGFLFTTTNQFFMTKAFVVIFMVVFSTGEHILMPLRSSIAMALAKQEKSGAALGINSSLNQLGHIFGLLLVMGIFFVLDRAGYDRNDIAGFRLIFGISMGLMVTAAIVVLALQETALKAPRQRFYFARKFRKFYILEVFYGGRKQIFSTFAPLVLVSFYGAPAFIMAMLRTVSSGFSMVLAPVVGKLIDRVGYKAVMVADSILLIIVCSIYGFAHIVFPKETAFIIICVTFIVDALISMGRMAANVYAKRISSSQEEVTATLSTGISVDHVISISMALLGGTIWSFSATEGREGFVVLFVFAAILGLAKCLYTLTIKKSEEADTN